MQELKGVTRAVCECAAYKQFLRLQLLSCREVLQVGWKMKGFQQTLLECGAFGALPL
jgi:hypothetical protein